MLETNLAPKAVRRFVEQFAQLTNYDDIDYCSTSANVLIACKQTKDQQVPYFAEDLVFISGLRGREAHDSNESSALTASFASVPINILAVSSKTIPAQVMEHADSLRSGGISRNRHTILITPCIQKEVQYKNQGIQNAISSVRIRAVSPVVSHLRYLQCSRVASTFLPLNSNPTYLRVLPWTENEKLLFYLTKYESNLCSV